MKPRLDLSLEHNPRVGFGQQRGGGSSRGTRAHDTSTSCVVEAAATAEREGRGGCTATRDTPDVTWRPPSLITPQIPSRSSLWAASCPSPVSPVKRTRGETLPLSAYPARSGGPPVCQGRVTMATNQPSTSEPRSTGGTRSRYDVMLVYSLKGSTEMLCRVQFMSQDSAIFWQPWWDLHAHGDRPVNSSVAVIGCHLSRLLLSDVFVWALDPLRIPFCFSYQSENSNGNRKHAVCLSADGSWRCRSVLFIL